MKKDTFELLDRSSSRRLKHSKRKRRTATLLPSTEISSWTLDIGRFDKSCTLSVISVSESALDGSMESGND